LTDIVAIRKAARAAAVALLFAIIRDNPGVQRDSAIAILCNNKHCSFRTAAEYLKQLVLSGRVVDREEEGLYTAETWAQELAKRDARLLVGSYPSSSLKEP
jgi:predicted transcriptional regulator